MVQEGWLELLREELGQHGQDNVSAINVDVERPSLGPD
jgi:hypothetical protein